MCWNAVVRWWEAQTPGAVLVFHERSCPFRIGRTKVFFYISMCWKCWRVTGRSDSEKVANMRTPHSHCPLSYIKNTEMFGIALTGGTWTHLLPAHWWSHWCQWGFLWNACSIIVDGCRKTPKRESREGGGENGGWGGERLKNHLVLVSACSM